MAARGRALVLDRYDWDVLADALERCWEKCLGSRAPARPEEAAALSADRLRG
jgi:hypothetical protein